MIPATPLMINPNSSGFSMPLFLRPSQERVVPLFFLYQLQAQPPHGDGDGLFRDVRFGEHRFDIGDGVGHRFAFVEVATDTIVYLLCVAGRAFLQRPVTGFVVLLPVLQGEVRYQARGRQHAFGDVMGCRCFSGCRQAGLEHSFAVRHPVRQCPSHFVLRDGYDYTSLFMHGFSLFC